MKRIIVVIFALTALALLSCKKSDSAAPPSPGAAAPQNEAAFIKLLLASDDIEFVCEKLDAFIESVSRGDARARCDLTLAPLETTGAVTEAHYLVRLGEVWVPVLDRDYDLEFKQASGVAGLIATLRTAGHTTQLAAAADPPRNDFYAAPDAQPAELSAETKALFGAAPTTFELVREAYTKKLSDYKCDAASKLDAIKLGVLLNIKRGVFAGAALSVHPDVGVEGSLLWLVEMPKGRVIKHEFAGAGRTFSVIYAVQSDKLYADTMMLMPGLATATAPDKQNKEPPEEIVLAARAVAGEREAVTALLNMKGLRLTSESKAALGLALQ